jgi:hypothetical protein
MSSRRCYQVGVQCTMYNVLGRKMDENIREYENRGVEPLFSLHPTVHLHITEYRVSSHTSYSRAKKNKFQVDAVKYVVTPPSLPSTLRIFGSSASTVPGSTPSRCTCRWAPYPQRCTSTWYNSSCNFVLYCHLLT